MSSYVLYMIKGYIYLHIHVKAIMWRPKKYVSILSHSKKKKLVPIGQKNIFMLSSWKVCQGHLVFRSSVCLFLCHVSNLVAPTYKVQYLKFGWSYIVHLFKSCSHVTYITLNFPCGWGRSKCRTILGGGASVFHKHTFLFSFSITELISECI